MMINEEKYLKYAVFTTNLRRRRMMMTTTTTTTITATTTIATTTATIIPIGKPTNIIHAIKPQQCEWIGEL